MAQNKKLIKSISHLHPKISEGGKTSSDYSHAASFGTASFGPGWAMVMGGMGVGAPKSVWTLEGDPGPPSTHSPSNSSPVSPQLTQRNN